MSAVRIRRREVGETGLSPDEVAVALREGFEPVGPSDGIVVVVQAPKTTHLLHVRAKRITPSSPWNCVNGRQEAKGGTL